MLISEDLAKIFFITICFVFIFNIGILFFTNLDKTLTGLNFFILIIEMLLLVGTANFLENDT